MNLMKKIYDKFHPRRTTTPVRIQKTQHEALWALAEKRGLTLSKTLDGLHEYGIEFLKLEDDFHAMYPGFYRHDTLRQVLLAKVAESIKQYREVLKVPANKTPTGTTVNPCPDAASPGDDAAQDVQNAGSS
jgi:hypothetical protein